MIRRLAFTLLLAAPELHAQRDTTVCVAFRTRTTLAGAILSTSVTKVPCGGVVAPPAPPRVDTLWRTQTIRDTLTVDRFWSPNTNQVQDSIFWSGPHLWPVIVGPMPRPANFALPRAPAAPARVDTVTIRVPVPGPVRVDTVTIPRVCPICPVVPPPSGALTTRARSPYLTDAFMGGVHLGYVGASGVTWLAWRRLSFTPDSISMDNVSYTSAALAIDALTKPYTGPISPAAIVPELPRVYLDTRMPPAPAPGGVIIPVTAP